MINIVLDDYTAEDMECILELQRLGIPDDQIQEYYDRERKRRQELRGKDNGI